MGVKIGINGFGRIGRMIATAAHADPDKSVEVVAVNDLTDADTLVHLLRYDSVHGVLDADVKVSKEGLKLDDHEIVLLQEKDASKIPWKELGVDIVLECTGKYKTRELASMHFEGGAKYVLISAPGKKEDITICMGINHHDFDPKKHKIVSNASCTTNCVAFVAKILHENFEINRAMMTTIHSYTQDQNLLDGVHKDLRRARAAALSMVPASTGATLAVERVLPDLRGKLTGTSIRVPTPNVSLVDFTAFLEKPVSVERVNNVFKESAQGDLSKLVGYTEELLVSVDYNGSQQSAIIDGSMTQVCGDRLVKVFAWYDNESGYSHRMLDLAFYMGQEADLL